MTSIFETKKHGVSLYFGPTKDEAEDAFKKAQPGDVVMYQIVGGKKQPLKAK